ncbi:inositol monophosphatase family protein [Athalassotoga saccharophila]|uniref:inositol monophosphatase family protein n=1 Tax=Athalassotoga saccharophila TaxID=1441386 RepID=UPI00137B17D8|nr:inositol monophosphatase family protein [Athalassotoga saccharophila]BBJ27528.1 inositol-1-monophosphatase [Athalassotoga saccharophila]
MEIIEIMIEAAKKAGSILKDGYESSYDVKIKSSSADLVTSVDLDSQSAIIETLEKTNIPIVAEESTQKITEKNAFYVDPLDGTLNFVHGIPFFCVSIGYWENEMPIIGVVYDPLRDELFYGIKDKGAYLNGKKLSVKKKDLKDSILSTGLPYNRQKMMRAIEETKKIISSVQEVRILGSAALSLCYLAAGRIDGYWEDEIYPWDVAAGIAISTEAGVKITNFDGKDYKLKEIEIVGAIPEIHQEILRILKGF